MENFNCKNMYFLSTKDIKRKTKDSDIDLSFKDEFEDIAHDYVIVVVENKVAREFMSNIVLAHSLDEDINRGVYFTREQPASFMPIRDENDLLIAYNYNGNRDKIIELQRSLVIFADRGYDDFKAVNKQKTL